MLAAQMSLAPILLFWRWQYWLGETGHLVCETLFENGEAHCSYKRFHPNGEVSQFGSLKHGKFTERVHIRSTSVTNEDFPSVGDHVWKVVYEPGVGNSYFDSNGDACERHR